MNDAEAQLLHSHRTVLLTGYVRVRDMERLQGMLDEEFPSVSLVARDPEDIHLVLRIG